MAETIIGSVIAGTVTDPTGLAFQNHLIWASNDAAWWLFYLGSSDNTAIKTYRSPDGTTWTAKTASPALSTGDFTPCNFNSQGRNFGVGYKNISSNDVVHVDAWGTDGTTNMEHQHIRATISAGAITWGSWGIVSSSPKAFLANAFPSGCGTILDSSNRPVDVGNFDGGNIYDARATNTDSGSSWTAGFAAEALIDGSMTNAANASLLLDLGSGNLLELCENGHAAEPSSMDNVRWCKYTGSWGANAAIFTAFTAEDPNNFGAVALSTSDVHCVVRTGSTTYTHKRFNGTDWTTLSGASIPNVANTAGTGMPMATDGTSVWLINVGSVNNPVQYIKWAAGAWDAGWTTLESTNKSRKFITCWPTVANNKIGVVWTETNGSNFDVAFEAIALASPLPGDDDSLFYQFRSIW